MKTSSFAILGLSFALTTLAGAQQTTWVSRPLNGAGANAPSLRAQVSGDGGTVVFLSDISSLVPFDVPGTRDVFAYDRASGSIEIISRNPDGFAVGAETGRVSVSQDGRYVAYASTSEAIVPSAETFTVSQVYVYDRGTETTVLISKTAADPLQQGGQFGSAGDIALSADGRFVGFTSNGSNGPGWAEYMVADRDPDGNGIFDEQPLPDLRGLPFDPATPDVDMSDDGRFFLYQAAPLASGAPGPLMRYDRDADEDGIFDEPGQTSTLLVSIDATGSVVASAANFGPRSFSGDGRSALFPGSISLGFPGWVVRDIDAGVSVAIAPSTGLAQDGALSADGRFAVVPVTIPGTPGQNRLVRVDRDADGNGVFDEGGTTRMQTMSLSSSSMETTIDAVYRPDVSDDGNIVSFEAMAELVPGAGGGLQSPTKIYVRDTTLGEPIETYCFGSLSPPGCVASITWSGFASLSSGDPFLVQAEGVPDQNFGLLFYGFAPDNALFVGGRLCVSGPLRRTAVQNSGGAGVGQCNGTFQFDMNALIRSGVDPMIRAGTRIYAQYWHRDPASTSGAAVTDGLQFTVLP